VLKAYPPQNIAMVQRKVFRLIAAFPAPQLVGLTSRYFPANI
jgi:hypothetical protein